MDARGSIKAGCIDVCTATKCAVLGCGPAGKRLSGCGARASRQAVPSHGLACNGVDPHWKRSARGSRPRNSRHSTHRPPGVGIKLDRHPTPSVRWCRRMMMAAGRKRLRRPLHMRDAPVDLDWSSSCDFPREAAGRSWSGSCIQLHLVHTGGQKARPSIHCYMHVVSLCK